MLRGLACAASLFVLLAGQQPGRPLTLAEAQHAILTAEDSRLELPDGLHAPAIEALRARRALDVRLLVDLSRSDNPVIQQRAIRALGRYERRELTTDLLPLLPLGPGDHVAFALAQSLRGPALALDDSGEQVRGVHEALLIRGTNLRRDPSAPPSASLVAADTALPAIVRALGRLPYARPAQVQAVDAYFVRMFALMDPDPDGRPLMEHVADASESLTRLHRRLSPPGEETIAWLRRIVESRRRTYPPAVRTAAMRALVAANAVDVDTLRIAARETGSAELRRLATISLAAGGSAIIDSERTSLVLDLLRDTSPAMRIEAVRAWARQETAVHGCPRLLDVLRDEPNIHVVLVTIGLLGEACQDDETVSAVLAGETREPRSLLWHREAHALVALARRAPHRAEAPMRVFAKHPEWHVRMYAARAASILNDVPVLERLALDEVDNVREATLVALRRNKGPDVEPYFVEALKRNDLQLLRTAARELRGLPPAPALVVGLVSALTRLTAERIETSRDTRLALLERLAELGDENHAGALVGLLRDFDIRVAQQAAATLGAWTGRTYEIDPQLLGRPPVPSADEIQKIRGQKFQVSLAGGRTFDITLLPSTAPLTSVTFMRLAEGRYYDDRPFHRVVPNFVVQGPGDGEYTRLQHYARDERGDVLHRRGTVGLSTRGRDTGDMQFFINLVDNPRLDHEYTVFGRVSEEHMEIVEGIVEGDRIRTIRMKKEEEKKKG